MRVKNFSLHSLMAMTFLIVQLTVSTSCVQDSGRKGRPLINDGAATSGGQNAGGCGENFYISGDTSDTPCINACAPGQRIADQNEIDSLLASADDEIRNIIENSAGVCVVDSSFFDRPTKQVFVENNFCVCRDGEPFIINGCDNTCSSRPVTSVPVLYANTTLGTDILLNESLGNLFNWCNAEIPGSNQVSPSCTLRAFDGSTTFNFQVSLTPNSNSFSAELGALPQDTTFIMSLVASGSGGPDAESVEFQLRLREPESNVGIQGPLKIMPVSQYTCIERSFTFDSNNPSNITIIDSRDRHFYFPANEEPVPLPPNNPQVKCHDVGLFGENDGPLFPRLGLIPQAFAAWDINDARFADQNQNDIPDISDTIAERLLDEFQVIQTVDVFRPLVFPRRPDTGVENDPSIIGQSANSGPVGVVMQPFIDPTTGVGFCPTQVNYQSSDPVFQVLGDVIGVDTEGLFFALEETEVVDNGNNTITPSVDIILIRENLLKQIWFYEENGQRLVPNAITAGQRTVHFFYPPDVNDPLVKKSTQTTFTIKRASELGGTPAPTQSNGLPSNVSPPDRRFGCVPAID